MCLSTDPRDAAHLAHDPIVAARTIRKLPCELIGNRSIHKSVRLSARRPGTATVAAVAGVVLFGPRQAGKTTLARTITEHLPGALILDLERESDWAALRHPELFFAAHRGRLLVLHEVQLAPDLFAALRPEIDADRRPGRFLLLGSASGDLLRQSSESLAGRVSYLELTPLLASEVPVSDLFDLDAAVGDVGGALRGELTLRQARSIPARAAQTYRFATVEEADESGPLR